MFSTSSSFPAVSKVLITGSADGLGQMAARRLVDDGHDVILHARSRRRADDAMRATPGAREAVVGDLSSNAQTRAVAEQANAAGPLDAVIHNAGVGFREPRIETADGLAHVFAINVLAPYLLTALIERPQRLIYLSSGMHRGGRARLTGMDWSGQRATGSYSDSKLFVTALAVAVARMWPDVLSNAVDPGWVPTKMGGPSAPDELRLGHLTQEWLATSDESEARTSGGYWHHQRPAKPAPAVHDQRFQDDLLETLAHFTATPLPREDRRSAQSGAVMYGPRDA